MSIVNFDLFEDNIILNLLEYVKGDIPFIAQNMENMIGDRAYRYWYELAAGVRNWGQIYADSIVFEPATNYDSVVRVFADETAIVKSLNKPAGVFINIIEEGMAPFSIRDALMKSKRVKHTQDGVAYIIVPFRWRTREAKGSGSGFNFTGTMTKEVQDMAKKGIVPRGSKFGNMAGLTRYGDCQHGKYFTFRICHEFSTGWKHPGSPAQPVFQRVISYVEKQICEMISEFVCSYGDKLNKDL